MTADKSIICDQSRQRCTSTEILRIKIQKDARRTPLHDKPGGGDADLGESKEKPLRERTEIGEDDDNGSK